MSKNPIPADWDGQSWCSRVGCWPDSVLWNGLLTGLVSSPQRGRFWDEKTGSILDIQDTGREIFDRNSSLEECCMACTEATSVADAIISAVSSMSGSNGVCGCGSGGASSEEPPDSPIEPGAPGQEEGSVPPGFDTWSEYEDYKCAIATWIVERVQIDLAWFETVDWLTITATSVVAALVTPIPFDDIAAITGFMVALTLEGVLLTAAQDLQNAVAGDFDDFVCALYQGGNASESKANWDAQVEVSVDAQTGAFYAFIEKSILRATVSNSAINKLFDKDVSLANTIDPGSCVGCNPCPQAWVWGSGDLENGGTWLSGDSPGPEHRIQWHAGSQQKAIMVSLTGWTDAAGSPEENFRLASEEAEGCSKPNGNDVLDQINPPTLPFAMDCVQGGTIRSATEFEMEWTVEGPGENCP